MTKEYTTTSSSDATPPVQPNGDGWRMCAATCAAWFETTFVSHRLRFYWFWERDVEETKP